MTKITTKIETVMTKNETVQKMTNIEMLITKNETTMTKIEMKRPQKMKRPLWKNTCK